MEASFTLRIVSDDTDPKERVTEGEIEDAIHNLLIENGVPGCDVTAISQDDEEDEDYNDNNRENLDEVDILDLHDDNSEVEDDGVDLLPDHDVNTILKRLEVEEDN